MLYIIIQLIIIFTVALYLTNIIRYIYGWCKIDVYNNSNVSNDILVSIIIPARNEEYNIKNIVIDIVNQDYLNFELIIVDDNSEDLTKDIIIDLCKPFPNIKLIDLSTFNKCGKKQALAVGINEAKGSLIVTTDADCRINKQWLTTIVSFYETYKPKMIISPVIIDKGNNIFHKLQSFEFLSLTGSTAGAVGINKSIMCNGANLAFEKAVYNEFNDAFDNTYTSGDDVLFMLKIKNKYNYSIKYLKSINATVVTQPQDKLIDFINQRIRWVSKSKSYRDFDVIFSAITVFLINILLMVTFVLSFFNITFLKVFLSIFFIKSIVDYTLLYITSAFFDKHSLMILFLPLQFIYFFYVFTIGLLGTFVKFDWKNRTYKL